MLSFQILIDAHSFSGWISIRQFLYLYLRLLWTLLTKTEDWISVSRSRFWQTKAPWLPRHHSPRFFPNSTGRCFSVCLHCWFLLTTPTSWTQCLDIWSFHVLFLSFLIPFNTIYILTVPKFSPAWSSFLKSRLDYLTAFSISFPGMFYKHFNLRRIWNWASPTTRFSPLVVFSLYQLMATSFFHFQNFWVILHYSIFLIQ